MTGLWRLAGILLSGNGWLLRGSKIAFCPEKSPLCSAGVSGKMSIVPGEPRCFVPWKEKKKKFRFLLIGPPIVPPYWFLWNGGRFAEKNDRASKTVLRTNSNNEPWNSFVPDLVAAWITAPAFLPLTALKE